MLSKSKKNSMILLYIYIYIYKNFRFIGNIFFGLNLSDILYTYILGKTSSAKKLSLQYRDFRICVEIPILAKETGAQLIIINNEPTQMDHLADLVINQDISEVLSGISL